MIVYPSSKGFPLGWLCGKWPDKIGLLGGHYLGKLPHWAHMVDHVAVDNGRFVCWTNQKPWDESAFLKYLGDLRQRDVKLQWVVVPDVVADRDGTLRQWDSWAPRLQRDGFPLAMAVQDGMTAADVPSEADWVFVGGSTDWKRATIHEWCESFPSVHVGRINTEKWLRYCYDAGAESCDGTGWVRGDRKQFEGLVRFLDSPESEQGSLFELADAVD